MTTNGRHRQPDDDPAVEHEGAAEPAGTGADGDEVLGLLDSTLPPTPLKKLLAADGASVYVLSADGALIDAVHEAGGEQYPIDVIADWQALRAAVDGGRCRIALLDAEAVPGHLEKRIAELRDAVPSLVILVAAPRETAQQLIGLLSDRSIHRLLIKPAAIGITRLLLESAVNRYLQAREKAHESNELAFDTPRRQPPEGSATKWPAWMLATALVSLAFGGLLVGGLSGLVDLTSGVDGGAESESAPARAATVAPGNTEAVVDAPVATVDSPGATQAGEDPFAARLAQAAQAVEQGRIAAPEGESALDRYAAILAEDPAHDAASRALADLLETVFGQAETALLDGALEEAAAALAHIRRVRPESSRLAFLETQLQRARDGGAPAAAVAESRAAAGQTDAAESRAADPPVADAEAAAAAVPSGAATAAAGSVDADADAAAGSADADADAAAAITDAVTVDFAAADAGPAIGGAEAGAPLSRAELDSLLTIARARIEQGRLLEPAGDSARDYVERAAERDPNDPRLVQARAELAAAVGGQARVVLDQGDMARADELIEEAFSLGADEETLTLLDMNLSAAREALNAQRLTAGIERIRQGRFVAPDGDSAFSHLVALREDAPQFPGLAAAWADLTEAVVASANEAIDSGNWNDAEARLDTLARLDPGPATLDRLRGELEYERTQADFLAVPAPVSAMRVLESGRLRYPREAQVEDIEGWAEVEFVIDEAGLPRQPRVVRAEPPGWFEDAAAASITEYRFVPFEQDGRIYRRLVRVRINFDLE